MAYLELKDLSKIYAEEGAVSVGIRKVPLAFDKGEFVTITGKSGMAVALTVYESIPFFGIIGHDEKVVKFSELGMFVRYGIYFAFVLFFKLLHLCVQLAFLIDPIIRQSLQRSILCLFRQIP